MRRPTLVIRKTDWSAMIATLLRTGLTSAGGWGSGKDSREVQTPFDAADGLAPREGCRSEDESKWARCPKTGTGCGWDD